MAQDDERRRIARELHDEAGQALASLIVRLRTLQDAPSLGEAKTQATRLRKSLSDTIGGLARLARGLHPSLLDDLGLGPALKRHAADTAEAPGMPIRVTTKGLGPGAAAGDRDRAVPHRAGSPHQRGATRPGQARRDQPDPRRHGRAPRGRRRWPRTGPGRKDRQGTRVVFAGTPRHPGARGRARRRGRRHLRLGPRHHGDRQLAAADAPGRCARPSRAASRGPR